MTLRKISLKIFAGFIVFTISVSASVARADEALNVLIDEGGMKELNLTPASSTNYGTDAQLLISGKVLHGKYNDPNIPVSLFVVYLKRAAWAGFSDCIAAMRTMQTKTPQSAPQLLLDIFGQGTISSQQTPIVFVNKITGCRLQTI